MLVKELKKALEGVDEELEVVVSGLNGTGFTVEEAEVGQRGYIYGDGSATNETQEVLTLGVDEIIADWHDFGERCVWVNERQLQGWNEIIEDEGDGNYCEYDDDYDDDYDDEDDEYDCE